MKFIFKISKIVTGIFIIFWCPSSTFQLLKISKVNISNIQKLGNQNFEAANIHNLKIPKFQNYFISCSVN